MSIKASFFVISLPLYIFWSLLFFFAASWIWTMLLSGSWESEGAYYTEWSAISGSLIIRITWFLQFDVAASVLWK